MFPTLFNFGHLSLPTFGALAAVGIMLALALSERTAVLAQVDPAKLWDAGIFTVVAAFLLSRLLLLIAYWKTFAAFPILLLTVPSLTAGGLLLTAIASTVFLRFKRVPLLSAFDAWAPSATVLWASLALGHFAEGSDAGSPTTLPWGLPTLPGASVHRHPVALYLAVIALLLALASRELLRRKLPAGITAGCTVLAAGLAQFLATFVRQPASTTYNGLEPMQWLGLAMMLAAPGLIFPAFFAPQRGSA